ncbi:MAG: protoporphyrinogen oxidase [Marinilabiliaceae bacterium]|nr:protoporphyrinogen oxidase [Marinilabiliaceae bacterium]
MTTDIVVIGAGLTGLTTAYTLAREERKVMVLERMNKAGGQIQTHSEDGFVFESGPNTGVVSVPEVAELMQDLQVVSGGKCRLEEAPASSKRRLIWKGKKFHALPSGPLSAITTPLFTIADKFRILGEPWRKKGTNPDESVGSLARRRLGKSFVDYAVDPFLSGVYAGNPDALVTRFALPKLYNLEQNYGSFIRGAMAKARIPKTDRDKLATKKVFSAVGGLGKITEAMADYLGDRILLGLKDIKVMPDGDGWRISFSDADGNKQQITCNKVVTTCGAYSLPELLPFVDDEIMSKVNNLRYSPVVEICVGVKDTKGLTFQAFGGLVPSRENKKVLGILFPSACFEGRAPEGGALFSYFIGGMKHAELLDYTDEQLTALVEEYFHTMLKFPASVKPDFIRISRHRKAIPQYEITSGERFEAIEQLQKRYKGLIIAGNLRDGIGMAHRIKQATDVAQNILSDD